MKSTWCPAFNTGRVTVRRRGGGLGASSTGATHRACSLSTGDPGNSEAVCPSDPMPSSTKSKRGNAPKHPRSSPSYSAAAASKSSASAFIRCTDDSAIPKGRNNTDRKSTRLNSSHSQISYAVFCLKKKKKELIHRANNAAKHGSLVVAPC